MHSVPVLITMKHLISMALISVVTWCDFTKDVIYFPYLCSINQPQVMTRVVYDVGNDPYSGCAPANHNRASA